MHFLMPSLSQVQTRRVITACFDKRKVSRIFTVSRLWLKANFVYGTNRDTLVIKFLRKANDLSDHETCAGIIRILHSKQDKIPGKHGYIEHTKLVGHLYNITSDATSVLLHLRYSSVICCYVLLLQPFEPFSALFSNAHLRSTTADCKLSRAAGMAGLRPLQICFCRTEN
ncbi:hypothetical protein POM88_012934 [Heracleum sosnowskyi]|uniref:Uncharacterized protein n=1 Tax=Heracleum sosnowskyi TaxID=360622 RepID=A0AAD8IYZ7_9APIA|nr:hypothetical protein POM88_012934 [Heracleum sosnowskyi]